MMTYLDGIAPIAQHRVAGIPAWALAFGGAVVAAGASAMMVMSRAGRAIATPVQAPPEPIYVTASASAEPQAQPVTDGLLRYLLMPRPMLALPPPPKLYESRIGGLPTDRWMNPQEIAP